MSERLSSFLDNILMFNLIKFQYNHHNMSFIVIVLRPTLAENIKLYNFPIKVLSKSFKLVN